jgi:hypothetical protein
VTEADVLRVLAGRYAQRSGNGPAWAFVPHVRNAAGFSASRTCDAMALGLWPSKGLELHGHEVKCSRSDWLRELKDPSKARAFSRYCDRWWIVAPPGVVRVDEDLSGPGELPMSWGLLIVHRGRIRCLVEAPKLEPESLPRTFFVAFTRAAIRNGTLGGEHPAAPDLEPDDLRPEHRLTT